MDSSCKIICKVLNSSEPEICKERDGINSPSASTCETMPTIALESKQIVKSIGRENNNLHRPLTSDNILDNAMKSLTTSVTMLLAVQLKCNDPLLRIIELLETLPRIPNCQTLLDKKLVDTLNSLIAPSECILEDIKRENTFGLMIKIALYTIKDEIPISSSASKKQSSAILSAYSSINQFLSERTSQRYLLKVIKKLVCKFHHSASEDGNVVDAMQWLKLTIELIISEQYQQNINFRQIKELLDLILHKRKLNKLDVLTLESSRSLILREQEN